MDGALTFIHICVDSSQTVLEHHRSFAPFVSVHVHLTTYIVYIKNYTLFIISPSVAEVIPSVSHQL